MDCAWNFLPYFVEFCYVVFIKKIVGFLCITVIMFIWYFSIQYASMGFSQFFVWEFPKIVKF